MGDTLANFHLLGTTPSESDWLNNLHKEGAISLASSFNNLPGIPSGPPALFGSKFLSTAATSSSDSSISDNTSTEVSEGVEIELGGSI